MAGASSSTYPSLYFGRRIAFGVAGRPTVPERPLVDEPESDPFAKVGDLLLALLLDRTRLLKDPPDDGGLSGKFPPTTDIIAAV